MKNLVRVAATVAWLASASGAAMAQLLVLEDAWVRALPPTMNRTAAYMTLINRGDATAEVVGGRAELAQTVEIHTTRDVDGYRRMEQLDSISIAPDQRVRLQPGGTHLMLLGLSRMPAAGETLPLCVGLASGAEVCTVAQVRTAAGRQSEPGHHHQHQK
ncbi:MAG: copper chaperone PCu(A)C [Halioglobus sp.]|nr:copper chaperone PCu(A)C [Halioglobus sp.]